jgi:hypothetical protein
MADVRRPPAESRNGSGSDDRGQLLLVGALALAVVFIALALLLNTAIYTGNLATRDSGVEAAPAVEYVSESRQAGIDAIASVNRRNNTSAADLNRAFAATVNRWDDLASYHRAVAGDAADVDVAGTTNGTRIQQDDADRRYTSNTPASNWTVVEGSGVTAVRSIQFTVDNSTLTSIDDASNATSEPVFHVTVDSSLGTTRTAYIYRNTTSGTSEVLVDNGTETVCPVESDPDDTFVVDVPNASAGGASCSALGTLDDTEGEVSIEYGDGSAAGGTYTMVVEGHPTDSDVTLSELNPDGSESPYWTHAIYSANLTVTYRTGELDYEATVEVVPE